VNRHSINFKLQLLHLKYTYGNIKQTAIAIQTSSAEYANSTRSRTTCTWRI